MVYKTSKRTRQAIWEQDEPDYEFAIHPPTKNVGKALLSELENEERDRIKSMREFEMPEFRSGDLIGIPYSIFTKLTTIILTFRGHILLLTQ